MTALPFVYDDGGRAAAGFRGDAGDCAVRSIAIATGLPYRDVYDALAAGMAGRRVGRARGASARTARDGVLRPVYEGFLLGLGWLWAPTMSIGSGTRVHLAAGELPEEGPVIARCSRHLCAIIDGVFHDTHDPARGGTRAVYGYFEPGAPR